MVYYHAFSANWVMSKQIVHTDSTMYVNGYLRMKMISLVVKILNDFTKYIAPLMPHAACIIT